MPSWTLGVPCASFLPPGDMTQATFSRLALPVLIWFSVLNRQPARFPLV